MSSCGKNRAALVASLDRVHSETEQLSAQLVTATAQCEALKADAARRHDYEVEHAQAARELQESAQCLEEAVVSRPPIFARVHTLLTASALRAPRTAVTPATRVGLQANTESAKRRLGELGQLAAQCDVVAADLVHAVTPSSPAGRDGADAAAAPTQFPDALRDLAGVEVAVAELVASRERGSAAVHAAATYRPPSSQSFTAAHRVPSIPILPDDLTRQEAEMEIRKLTQQSSGSVGSGKPSQEALALETLTRRRSSSRQRRARPLSSLSLEMSFAGSTDREGDVAPQRPASAVTASSARPQSGRHSAPTSDPTRVRKPPWTPTLKVQYKL